MIDSADVVVIGAGAFGASAAYHLARLGQRNVVLLDKFALGSQTSPRAAGLTGQVRATDVLTRLAMRGVSKLATFSQETGQPLRFDQTGALKIARTEQHVAQLKREVARGKAWGVDVDFVSTADARALMPLLMDTGVQAITYSPTDCNVEPSQLAVGYCRAAEALGVTTLPNTSVVGFEVGPDGVEQVLTERGPIGTSTVVDAAGAWSRLVGELAGARMPLVPTRHQLFITEPIAGVTPKMPIARVIDSNVYLRHERGGLMLGGYESNPRQYDMRALGPSFEMADLELDIEVLHRLGRSVRDQFPIFQESTVRIAEHRGGLPTITTDDRYLVGPIRGVRGFWVMSGCCVGGLSISPALGEVLAQWIVDGEPPIDVSDISPDRFVGPELPEDELRERCRAAYANHYSLLSEGQLPGT
jgi:glycine/D-amino acid oxidase-like deaminating enzyme